MATLRKAPGRPHNKTARANVSKTTAIVPRPTRPDMPKGYGITTPNSDADFVPWADVDKQLAASRNYWICTSRPDGRPHAVPVWGAWVNGRIYFGTSPESRKARNIAANSHIVVHLESGDEAVIVEGTARRTRDKTELDALDEAYRAKYKMAVTSHPDSTIFAVEPQKVLAWRERDFNRRATKWVFGS